MHYPTLLSAPYNFPTIHCHGCCNHDSAPLHVGVGRSRISPITGNMSTSHQPTRIAATRSKAHYPHQVESNFHARRHSYTQHVITNVNEPLMKMVINYLNPMLHKLNSLPRQRMLIPIMKNQSAVVINVHTSECKSTAIDNCGTEEPL